MRKFVSWSSLLLFVLYFFLIIFYYPCMIVTQKGDSLSVASYYQMSNLIIKNIYFPYSTFHGIIVTIAIVCIICAIVSMFIIVKKEYFKRKSKRLLLFFQSLIICFVLFVHLFSSQQTEYIAIYKSSEYGVANASITYVDELNNTFVVNRMFADSNKVHTNREGIKILSYKNQGANVVIFYRSNKLLGDFYWLDAVKIDNKIYYLSFFHP